MKNIANTFLFLSLCLKIMKGENYIFSVIIAIYNTGRYLEDSIGSIFNQTLDINKIQIILINDGSIDQTNEICMKFVKEHPKNMLYIPIKHSGVSIARNIGLKYAKGKYINFLDADDKWDKNVFKHVLLFFRFFKNIYIVSCRLIFFEGKEKYHQLDYKFYKTRVINVTEEYNCIQLSSSSSFFHYSLIKANKFKEGIFAGEDTRFINNILLINPLLGLLKEAIYYYRKRADSSSTIQNQYLNENFYNSILKSVDQYLIDKSKQLYNKILPFIQFYIGYNLLYRIISPSYKYLEASKINKYYEDIEIILKEIDDKYILEQKILSLKVKIFVLSKKYNRDIRKEIIFSGENLIYNGYLLMNICRCTNILVWRFVRIINNTLHLEGKDNFFMDKDDYFYYCILHDHIYYPKYYYYSGYDIITMFGNIERGRLVVFDIPLSDQNNLIRFFISYKTERIELLTSLGWFSKIPNTPNGYYNSGKYIIKFNENRFNIFKYNSTLIKTFENKYCQDLKIIKRNQVIKIRNNFFKFNFKQKEIWIINDNLNIARGNGEYFFRFLILKKPQNIDYYFVIKKTSKDYKRLKYLGNILEYGSEEYLNIFLKADKIISSTSEEWVDNPFGNNYKYLKDLFNFKFIYISNGIIKDDLSFYLDRIKKNYFLIITSIKKEYKSLLEDKYGYEINNIILSGSPKFDYLTQVKNKIKIKKIVLIVPTWRIYIKGTYDSNKYESVYSQTFKSTEFFKFYNFE